MVKKAKWLGAVKKVFSPESKEKQNRENSPQSKKKWGFRRSKGADREVDEPFIDNTPAVNETLDPPPPAAAALVSPRLPETVNLAENKQNKHMYSVTLATAAAAEATIAGAQAAAEVVRLTASARFAGKSMDESAAIKIQTAFRGYLARRALQGLRGLVRLKTMIQSNSIKRQAATTFRCMQTLTKVQSQIRSRRMRMAEENQALQRQLLLNCERELEKLRMGEWDDSLQSKDQIEASMLSKQEAAIRRERALAYAFSHQQWKSSGRSANSLFTDPNNPQWGWSWLERWMARSWETTKTAVTPDKETDQSSVRSSATRSIVGGDFPSSSSSQKPCRTATRQALPVSATPFSKSAEDDSKSIGSLQSERFRRHSIAGSSVRDDESLASSPALRSYMAQTKSARAKSRLSDGVKVETPPVKLSAGVGGSAKKRLSFQTGGAVSPAITRRHSGPPKVDSATAAVPL